MKKYYIVIADIHGDINQLNNALNKADNYIDIYLPSYEKQYIFLGDYIDRQPYANDVLLLLKNYAECGAILLMGNHDYFLYGTANGDPLQALNWDLNGGEDTCTQMFGPPGVIPDVNLFRAYCHSKGYDKFITADKEQYTTMRWSNIIKNSWQYKLLETHATAYHETKHIFFSHAPQVDVKSTLSMRNLLWGTNDSYYDKPDSVFKVPMNKQMSIHGHFHRMHDEIYFPRIVNYKHSGINKTVILADCGCGCVYTKKDDTIKNGELHAIIISEDNNKAHIEAIL